MRTIPLTIEHARDVAALHIQGINTGFISSLGIDFVTALYEAIAKSASSFGYAVEDDDKVLGFVAFTTNLNRLYKSIIAKNGWRLALLLVGKMFSLQRIKRIFQTLFYPSRTKKMDLPEAELLSIAIDPEKYHKGLATELVQKSLEHCRNIGLDRVKVLVSANNEPANRLYQKCGFRLVRQIDSHGIKSNIYEAQTTEALKKNLDDPQLSHMPVAPGPGQKQGSCMPMPEPLTSTMLGTSGLMTVVRKRRSSAIRRCA